jgi:hypothetical protein
MFLIHVPITDRLCGLVVRVPGYRSRGPVSIPISWVGLERGPLSLVSTTEELLGWKGSSSSLENLDYGLRGSAMLTPLYQQKLALTSSTSGGRSVGIVRSRTQATEFCVPIITHTALIVTDTPGDNKEW